MKTDCFNNCLAHKDSVHWHGEYKHMCPCHQVSQEKFEVTTTGTDGPPMYVQPTDFKGPVSIVSQGNWPEASTREFFSQWLKGEELEAALGMCEALVKLERARWAK